MCGYIIRRDRFNRDDRTTYCFEVTVCAGLAIAGKEMGQVMKRNQIAWWLWAGGTVLIVLSWLKVVSATVGWIGFAIGLVGSVTSWGVRPPRGEGPAESPRNEK